MAKAYPELQCLNQQSPSTPTSPLRDTPETSDTPYFANTSVTSRSSEETSPTTEQPDPTRDDGLVAATPPTSKSLKSKLRLRISTSFGNDRTTSQPTPTSSTALTPSKSQNQSTFRTRINGLLTGKSGGSKLFPFQLRQVTKDGLRCSRCPQAKSSTCRGCVIPADLTSIELQKWDTICVDWPKDSAQPQRVKPILETVALHDSYEKTPGRFATLFSLFSL